MIIDLKITALTSQNRKVNYDLQSAVYTLQTASLRAVDPRR